MNKKNLLVIGAVILVALGVWFYFDSREIVGMQALEPWGECLDKAKMKMETCKSRAVQEFEQCIQNGWDPLWCVERMIKRFEKCEWEYEWNEGECYRKWLLS